MNPHSLTRRPTRLAACLALTLASGASAQSVDQIWNTKCVSCHGQNAQGGMGPGLALTPDWLGTRDREMYDKLTNHAMFGDGSKGTDLKPATAWAMINYVREMQERQRKSTTPAPAPKAAGVFESTHHNYRLETVVGDGLEIPWSVDWFDDGRMLITERSGNLRIHDGKTLSDPVRSTPSVRAEGQGGLMDVAVLREPGNTDPWVYLSFADAKGRDGMTKIVRGKIHNAGRGALVWSGQETIWQADADDYSGGGIHFGSRFVFDGQGHLFFSVGERGRGERAQDLTLPNGKIHRVNLDGSIPSDNPFVGQGSGVYESIWSFGHRNPQGLAMDANGTLWDTEHGPRGGDEVNIIKPATNYGWPLVSFGMNYNGTPFESPWPDVMGVEDKNIAMPAFRWLPSIAACGLDIAKGRAFPKWSGDLLAGGLAGQVVERLRFVDGTITEREELLRGIGRVRDVAVAPDGTVYVVLNDPHKIVRLVNAD